jgi:glycosyltransferase involved in cell wall biosynthesis
MRVALVSAQPSSGSTGGAVLYTQRIAEILKSTVDVALVTRRQSAFWDAALNRRVRELRPDVVHVQHELMLYGSAAHAVAFPSWTRALASRTPAAVTVHGVLDAGDIDGTLYRDRVPRLTETFVPGVLRWIFASIARLPAVKIVHSESLADRLISYGAKEHDVVVSPIVSPAGARAGTTMPSRDVAREYLGLPKSVPVVLTWGFLNAYKSFDAVLDGFALFREKGREAVLLFNVAPHPRAHADRAHGDTMETLLRRGNDAPGVRAGGFIPAADLPYYMAAADVAVFAYSRHIAESGPVTDTAVSGTPVLVSSVFPNLPPAISFAPTPQGVCEALERFFADPRSVAEGSAQLAAERCDTRVVAPHVMAYERAISRFSRR